MAHWVTNQLVISGASISAASWSKLAQKLEIAAVVNVRAEYQDMFTSPLPAAYLWLPIEDHTNPNPEQILPGVQFIDAAIRVGHKVLIHCGMGLSRSPTLAAAYLLWTGLSVEEAVSTVESSATSHYGPLVIRYTLTDLPALFNQVRA
jgi:serine/threonine/tyrosine-interacting protein